MTTNAMIELAAAVVILAGAIWLYRARRQADQGYGSQGAVILFVVAAIMAIHALGLMEYRPTQAEADYFREHMR